MTRVSDRAGFAVAVAEGGALPFLALALMRAGEVSALLDETKRAMAIPRGASASSASFPRSCGTSSSKW